MLVWDEGMEHEYEMMAREHHEREVRMAQVESTMKPLRRG